MCDVDLSDVAMHPVLQDVLNDTTKRQFIKVRDGVHIAVGYSLSNSTMLEGPDGVIIIDVTGRADIMPTLLEELRKVTSKPVQAIIYTHSHTDHTLGGRSVQESEGCITPEIWANVEWKNNVNVLREGLAEASIYQRAKRQLGLVLKGKGTSIGMGIGSVCNQPVRGERTLREEPLPPNRFLDKPYLETKIAGLNVTLLQVPSESPDHMVIWVPEWKVLCCGDIVYRSLPNVYPLRGIANRAVMEWVTAIDILNDFGAHYLLGGHTLPIVGKDNIATTLTEYRDGLQYIHDQTIRQMNLHVPPDEIPPNMTLPPSLQGNRMLVETYGRIDWVSRHTMCSQSGWFNGDVLQLAPLTNNEKAQRMVKLTGGVSKLLGAASEALENNDPKWALELSTYALQSNDGDHERARSLKNRALKVLAGQDVNGTGRNYYLTCLLEENDLANTKIPIPILMAGWWVLSIDRIFQKMAVRLIPEACQGVYMKTVFEFTDTKEDFTLTIRNSIMQIARKPSTDFDFKMTTTSVSMVSIISLQRPLSEAVSCGDVIVTGNTAAVNKFFCFFDDFANNPNFEIKPRLILN